jgi:hypothetical protein
MSETKAHIIAEQGGRLKDNSCWWFKGEALANGTHEEFAKDCTHLVQDLTSKHSNDIMTSYIRLQPHQLNLRLLGYPMGTL